MHSGRVNQHHLRARLPLCFRNVNDAKHAVARGLRLRTDDRKLLACERVQQRGFAGVRAAKDADETRAEWHG